MRFIDPNRVDNIMTWPLAISILKEGHAGEKPRLKDLLFEDAPGRLLGRAVHLPGIGVGMKVASVFPPNIYATPPKPAEDALFIVIREEDWRIDALVAGPPVTRWKTAADSALASSLLSPPDSRNLLCIGAGPIAEALIEAHVVARPSLSQIVIWNRTEDNARKLQYRLAEKKISVDLANNLAEAVAKADIITSATASCEPLIAGEWVRPGTHVDLVGGYSKVTRESDDDLIRKASIYVDCYDTTLDHVGDIATPIASGIITPNDVGADLFDLVAKPVRRTTGDEITLFKNGGGAHLDLMIASYIVKQALRSSKS